MGIILVSRCRYIMFIRCIREYYQETRSDRIDRKRINDINKFLNYTREIDVRWLFGEHCRVWLDGKQNKICAQKQPPTLCIFYMHII